MENPQEKDDGGRLAWIIGGTLIGVFVLTAVVVLVVLLLQASFSLAAYADHICSSLNSLLFRQVLRLSANLSC